MSNRKPSILSIFILVIVLIPIVCRGSCVQESTAVRALEIQGFSDVEIVEHDWFLIGFRGGSGGDAARFKAQATNPIGKKVNIYVFLGWPFKGATVRSL